MNVLDLGGYDAVLGIDWLKQFRPMNCDWVAKWLEIPYLNKTVRLQGVLSVPQEHITEISMEEVMQLQRSNELWATALLENSQEITAIPMFAVYTSL
jgi:hypothetical protein